MDSEGNTYDFAFRMNYSGVICDERVGKYRIGTKQDEKIFRRFASENMRWPDLCRNIKMGIMI